MPNPMLEWTPEQVATLRRLWREGHSASMVAEELDVSRNAVLGRVHRMGLTRNGSKPAVTKPVGRPSKPKPIREKSAPMPVNSMWGQEEMERRRLFAQRAAKGARAQLLAIMAETMRQ